VQQVSALIRFPTWLKNGLINAHFGPFGDGVNPIYTRSSVHPRLVDADIAALTMAGRVGGEVRPRQRIEHLRELIVRPSDYRLRIRLKYSRP